jgi:HD-GYP domain-containing protein (c-di-GMP phosphodiesterase class II)
LATDSKKPIEHASPSQRRNHLVESPKVKFLPVDVASLQPGGPLGFGLYYPSQTARRVLIVEPEQEFSQALKERLLQSKSTIYILSTDQDKYFAHLEANFERVIQKAEQEPETVASMAYDLTRHVMDKVIENPTVATVHRANHLIRGTVDLIISSPKALYTLLSLARHDYYTYTHSCNVGLFGTGLVRYLIQEGNQFNVHALGAAFFFHDIGKTEVGQKIINKPGPLDEEEEALMRRHTELGLKILERLDVLTPEARYVVLQHHERCNGKGYPLGLTKEQIHPFARICAIADVYDALTSDRSYRPRITGLQALTIMQKEMAGHFEASMLRSFIEMFKDLAVYTKTTRKD